MSRRGLTTQRQRTQGFQLVEGALCGRKTISSQVLKWMHCFSQLFPKATIRFQSIVGFPLKNNAPSEDYISINKVE
jgi:hypothetical protein